RASHGIHGVGISYLSKSLLIRSLLGLVEGLTEEAGGRVPDDVVEELTAFQCVTGQKIRCLVARAAGERLHPHRVLRMESAVNAVSELSVVRDGLGDPRILGIQDLPGAVERLTHRTEHGRA